MLMQNHTLLLAATVLIAGLAMSTPAHAQDQDEPKAPTLQVGDPAPPLKVERFLKGDPIKAYKSGHTYVVEFWATWCGPCIACMPHLTELQKKFADKVTFISVNIWESPEYSDRTLAAAREFVKKNDEKMGYTVAYDGAAKKMDKTYMQAAGQNGIPCAFVVTPEGKIGYIGHPMMPRLEETLTQLNEGKFDMNKAIAAYKEEQAREAAMEKAYRRYREMISEAIELIDADKIDAGLAKIDEAAKLLPEGAGADANMVKFNVLMGAEKYDRAYAIGAKLVAGPIKDNPSSLNALAWAIVDPEANIAERDVRLALEAAELAVRLTESKNAPILDTLARCHWLKGDKTKAIELQTQAVALCEDGSPMKKSLQATLDEYAE